MLPSWPLFGPGWAGYSTSVAATDESFRLIDVPCQKRPPWNVRRRIKNRYREVLSCLIVDQRWKCWRVIGLSEGRLQNPCCDAGTMIGWYRRFKALNPHGTLDYYLPSEGNFSEYVGMSGCDSLQWIPHLPVALDMIMVGGSLLTLVKGFWCCGGRLTRRTGMIRALQHSYYPKSSWRKSTYCELELGRTRYAMALSESHHVIFMDIHYIALYRIEPHFPPFRGKYSLYYPLVKNWYKCVLRCSCPSEALI